MAVRAVSPRDATRLCVAVYITAALLIDLSYLIHLATGGSMIGKDELPSTLFFFAIWTPLMPLVVYAARRFPFTPGRRLRAFDVHFGLAFVLSFLTLVAHKLVFCPHGSCYFDCVTYYRAEAWMARWFGLDFFIYGAVLSGIWILDSIEGTRQKEFRASAIERELAAAELKLVNAQVSPDFLREMFDWLAAEVDGDGARAEALITLVADYLRLSVHAIGVSGLTIADDIELTSAWLAIAGARHGRTIEVSVEASENIQSRPIVGPILQPLIAAADLSRAVLVRICGRGSSAAIEISLEVDGVTVGTATA